MAQTIEVRFKGNRRGFYDWLDLEAPLKLNEAILVEAERGLDFGYVNTTGDTASAKCGGCDSCGVPDPAGTVVKLEEEGEARSEKGEASGNEKPIDESRETRDEVAPVAEAENPSADSREPEASAPANVAAPKAKVIRRASPDDIAKHREIRREEDDVRRKVIERVKAYELGMRISDAEWQWDRNRLTLYFTAERRVDFRKLVRELASSFRTRIELRQIGVRDEAARLGGVGRCGREYCCSTWLTEPGPVNLALAKDQHLSLNPSQISGGCGRLLCCLKYEHDFYLASRKRYPKEGKLVRTLLGPEKVIAVDIFRERVSLRSDEHGMRTIPVLDLREEMEKAPPAPAESTAAGRPAAPSTPAAPPPPDRNRGPRRPPRGGPPPRTPQ